MRFFVEHQITEAVSFFLTDENAEHLAVLRVNEDDTITVLNGDGYEYICRIIGITKETGNRASRKRPVIEVMPEKKQRCVAEPEMKVCVYQAMPKSDKMELIVQKTVELGVAEIVPITSRYTVVKPNEKSDKKLAHYRNISEAAAKQSRRGIIPRIGEIMNLEQAIADSKRFERVFALYEDEVALDIKTYLKSQEPNVGSMAFFVGSEGGFSPDEAALFSANGIKTLTLGKRILRTETAAFAALIMLFYEYNIFGGNSRG